MSRIPTRNMVSSNGEESSKLSNFPQCPCSRHSGSSHAAQAYEREPVDDKQIPFFKALRSAKYIEYDRQQFSGPATENEGAKDAARLEKVTHSPKIDAMNLCKEEHRDIGGMKPMERFLAEEKAGTRARSVMNRKQSNAEHESESISLD